MISFHVSGTPIPQGSKKPMVITGRNFDIDAIIRYARQFIPSGMETKIGKIVDRLADVGRWPVRKNNRWLINTIDDNAKRLKPWRAAIAKVAQTAYRFDCKQCVANNGQPYADAVRIDCWFYFQRPKGDFSQSKKTPGILKATAKPYVLKNPDEDKLRRAVLDALKIGGVIHDDNRSQGGLTWKQFNPRRDDPEGVRVQIWFADEIEAGATLERKTER